MRSFVIVTLAMLVAASVHHGTRVRGRAADDSSQQQRAVTVLAAGDVATCTLPGARLTARILGSVGGDVLVAGDASYQSGKVSDPLRQCYDPTWGKYKARTHAVLGNHEYEEHRIDEFFDYFGARAGPKGLGYYSYDEGAWHIVGLNSSIAFDASSPQGRWLARDLANNRRRCTLAFFHHPRFTSGQHGGRHRMIPLWEQLQRGGVDVAISGHDHIYERFAPMTADGKRDDARGIRQFVVGTGGGMHHGIGPITENSEAHLAGTWGVLQLTLRDSGYDWKFIPTDGRFHDSGTGRCHDAPR